MKPVPPKTRTLMSPKYHDHISGDAGRPPSRTFSRTLLLSRYRPALELHDPAGRRAARTILVLDGAAAAVPVLPPDPLEVVHLEDEEGDDPEEGLGPGHAVHRIGEPRAPAMGRAAQLPGRGSYYY